MDPHTMFGVPPLWLVFIVIFWMIVAVALIGIIALYNELAVLIIAFLSIGTAMLIGQFGLGILIIPSLAVIIGAAILGKKYFMG